jgi:hypothetical protein
MIWERHASVLHMFYKVFGDFRSKLEVHMHVSYADVYEVFRIFALLCTKLPDLPCLIVPWGSGPRRGFPVVVICVKFDAEFEFRGPRACGLHRIKENSEIVIWLTKLVEKESELGRFGVLWGGSGGPEVCFLMGHKNFEVPEAVDSEFSRKIAKVIRS